ncbi:MULTISPECIES: hypothetical protein [Phyllobacterium]|uniref:Uncharacterized protein n=1 Tax=Phyllobacterium sophorae TaxID=1520277 RepID=A0A2P7B9Y4_9HYPH|nr:MULTISPECIES: hypothetical protein [Phyllobacterium]PSH63273.1 hypothetical protein CU103_17160 [Phyllobacterium sophorae]UXN63979.1 hypothetical protein N8E89_16145 [Phyllobacterium sp. A18/5-2]
MRLRELQEMRYDQDTGQLKLSGLNAFNKAKSVTVSIDSPEEFLNAVKTALADADSKPIAMGKDR